MVLTLIRVGPGLFCIKHGVSKKSIADPDQDPMYVYKKCIGAEVSCQVFGSNHLDTTGAAGNILQGGLAPAYRKVCSTVGNKTQSQKCVKN